ncbi:MAG: XapX domain-containing protein [Sulfobacillus acidophilus]|uniref:XapX domain-containing protein n=1 Tax=Sulfobacillus acidophilus TaxID=53633 RepID=A0A2T2WFN0_9FIRM|nr:MAG: XapX domain-containing protein [Sulfobacillus acidophilus]
MQYVYFGKTELKALIVGLITGALYGVLNLPIPAPNVLGGNLAILFTFIGLVIVGLWRHEIKLGRPPSANAKTDSNISSGQ